MSETRGPEPKTPESDAPQARRRGLFDVLKRMGGELVTVALGRIVGPRDGVSGEVPGAAAEVPVQNAGASRAAPAANWRVQMLHGVTETLRGAADQYVAAKLDEIEARVDEKLDEIEARLDRKVRELHVQLGELRDQEVRHRLRILRLTLIFTVLVAALSLVYKWVVKQWAT